MNPKMALIMISLILVLAVSGCTGTETTPTGNTITPEIEEPEESIPRIEDTNPPAETKDPLTYSLILSEESQIDKADCYARGLQDRVIVIESKYCSACQALKPTLLQIQKELGITIEFLDRTVEADRTKQEEMKFQTKYTPTVISNCNVYIGSKSKERYKYLISKDLEIE